MELSSDSLAVTGWEGSLAARLCLRVNQPSIAVSIATQYTEREDILEGNGVINDTLCYLALKCGLKVATFHARHGINTSTLAKRPLHYPTLGTIEFIKASDFCSENGRQTSQGGHGASSQPLQSEPDCSDPWQSIWWFLSVTRFNKTRLRPPWGKCQVNPVFGGWHRRG